MSQYFVERNGAFPALEFDLIAKAGQLEDPLHRDLGGAGYVEVAIAVTSLVSCARSTPTLVISSSCLD